MEPGWPASSREEEPILKHLPLRGEGCFERWVEVEDEAELLSVVRLARSLKLAVRPIPPFHDALPPEGGLLGVALRLGMGFEKIEACENGVWIGAAAPLAWAALYGAHASFGRAPGTLSDALEEGWIAPAVLKVRRLKGKGFEEVESAAFEPKALVVGALLKKEVRVTPPPAGAAFLPLKVRGGVDAVLLKARLSGIRAHGACLASTVLVNRDGADPRQLAGLLLAVRERVQAATGHSLEDRLGPPGRKTRV
jgi:UDP-N-acetylenolpyruvoylglucosamine reductase